MAKYVLHFAYGAQVHGCILNNVYVVCERQSIVLKLLFSNSFTIFKEWDAIYVNILISWFLAFGLLLSNQFVSHSFTNVYLMFILNAWGNHYILSTKKKMTWCLDFNVRNVNGEKKNFISHLKYEIKRGTIHHWIN